MIFISYSGKDRSIAKRLENIITSNGFEIWIDYRDLTLNGDIYGQILLAIQRCSKVVFINSMDSNNSTWVNLEKTLTASFNKPYLEFDADRHDETLNASCPTIDRFTVQIQAG